MGKGANGRDAARLAALDETERARLKLLTVGSYGADAMGKHTDAAFDLADEAIDASPTGLLQSWTALWLRSYDAQASLWSGMYRSLVVPAPPSRRRNGIFKGVITFYVDDYSQAADPVVTTIARTETVDASDLKNGSSVIPANHVVFTAPSKPGGTYALSLAGLGTLLAGLPAGDYVGKLEWADGPDKHVQAVKVVYEKSGP
jgi:hypothetical protein